LLLRANPAAYLQLAKADFASSSQYVREGQRIAELEAEIDMLDRQATALGAERATDVPPWVLLGVKIAARRERALRKACLWGGVCLRCILGSHVRTE
jgi:hypothetical protein